VEKNKLSEKDFFLIPIPITEKSRKTRGYNQSLLIAKRISDENKIMQNILFKNRNHIPQNKIKNRAERLGNVKNSFEVRKNELVENKIVILIDDVVTTGATLTEAKKVLKSSGAKKVFAFVVAH
jgi:competence protein ComFC